MKSNEQDPKKFENSSNVGHLIKHERDGNCLLKIRTKKHWVASWLHINKYEHEHATIHNTKCAGNRKKRRHEQFLVDCLCFTCCGRFYSFPIGGSTAIEQLWYVFFFFLLFNVILLSSLLMCIFFSFFSHKSNMFSHPSLIFNCCCIDDRVLIAFKIAHWLKIIGLTSLAFIFLLLISFSVLLIFFFSLFRI